MILLATDLDRTLLPNGPAPDDGGMDRLFVALQDVPHKLAYVSGRNLTLFIEAQEEFGIPTPDYFIASVGTELFRKTRGRLVEDDRWVTYVTEHEPAWDREHIVEAIGTSGGLTLQEVDVQNRFKISYYLPADEDKDAALAHIRAALAHLGITAQIVWSIDPLKDNIGLIDVLPETATKATALEFLRTEEHLVKEAVVYCGDSGNDILPLTQGFRSILVKNAPADVKSVVAKRAALGTLYIATGTDEENGNYASGILEGLQHFGILKHEEPSPSAPHTDLEATELVAADAVRHLEAAYLPDFGICPSAFPLENYSHQVWARDLAQAGGNYFAFAHPDALRTSLEKLFSYQRADGALPFKIEREYGDLKTVPGMRVFAKPLFNLIRGGKERPEFEGERFSGGEDTIPTIILAIGAYALQGEQGFTFAQTHYDQIRRAADFFEKKIDPADGLAISNTKNPDWADSLRRGEGRKLGTINVWWMLALEGLANLAERLDAHDDAESYRTAHLRTREGVLGKLFNKSGAYIRTAVGEDRVDAVASIFAAQFLLDVSEALRVEDTLEMRLRHSAGLKNFDPPYPASRVLFLVRLIGRTDQHNRFVWPWVTLQNILVKARLCVEHPDDGIRERFKEEAVADLADVAHLFIEAGGAYEMFDPETREPATSPLYEPPRDLTANYAAYRSAYNRLKDLGLL